MHSNKKPASVWLLLMSLHMTQYLGMGFLFVGLIAILRQQGASLESLSFVWLLGIFGVIKFLWAPLMDRFRIFPSGHYRGWLIICQSAMIITLMFMSKFDIEHQQNSIIVLCALLSFFSATQDNAAHALAYRLLEEHERGVGNGVQFAGGMLGSIVGGGGVMYLYPKTGWQGSMWLLAAGTSISLFQLLLFKENHFLTNSNMPKTISSLSNHFKRGWKFWLEPGHQYWLLILTFYPIGISMCFALLTPMLVDAGWEIDDIGLAINVNGGLIGIASTLICGWLIKRYGRFSVLVGSSFTQAGGLLLLMLPAIGIADKVSVYSAIGVLFLLYSPMGTILSTLMMDKTSAQSPTTDFSLQFSYVTLVGIITGVTANQLAAAFGYLPVIIFSSSICLIAGWISIVIFPRSFSQPVLQATHYQTSIPAKS